jgi:hypothetical protein
MMAGKPFAFRFDLPRGIEAQSDEQRCRTRACPKAGPASTEGQ